MKITFITGGARSGKSTFAETEARKRGEKVVYIATAQALDEEMRHRIEIHQRRRPDNWVTVEEPKYVSRALERIEANEAYTKADAVLLDCMALLVSNWLPLEQAEDQNSWDKLRTALLEEIRALIEKAKSMAPQIIIVTNEVGLGLVPEYPLGRLYRDLLGEANQLVAKASDEAYFLVSGIPMRLK